MARFSRLFKGLQTLLPGTGTEFHIPDELAHTINPFMEIPGRMPALEQLVASATLVSAAALTPSVDLLVTTKEEWAEVLYGSFSHDSATARKVQLVIVPSSGASVFLGRWTNMLSSTTGPYGQPGGNEALLGTPGAVTAASDVRPPQRPLAVPPGATLSLLGDSAAAVWSITAVILFARHPFPDRPFAW